MKIILLFTLFMLIVSETTYTLEYHKAIMLSEVSNQDRYMRFEWSDFNIPPGENVLRFEIKLSTFCEMIGDYNGGFGTTTVGPDLFWRDIDTIYDFFYEMEGTVIIEVPKDISQQIDFSGFFRLGFWWIGSNYFTIETISIITGEYAIEEEEEWIEYVRRDFFYNENGAYLDTGGKCPTLTKVEGGLQGPGFLETYYNCCKPDCSTDFFSKLSKHYPSRECHLFTGEVVHDHTNRDFCDGGTATSCHSQIPFMIKGCDIGFGFVSFGGKTPNCGKCYLIEFNGNGRYENTLANKSIKGKKMVVMTINYSMDIDAKNFRLVVPGGDPGPYNMCGQVFGYDVYLGNEYGGFARDCQEEVEWLEITDAEKLKRKRTCFINRCNNTYSRFPEAKNGCLFLSTFLYVSDYPTLNYYEVECPSFLKERY